MLGFKTTKGPAKVGDLLVNSVATVPYGSKLMEVVEILQEGVHIRSNWFYREQGVTPIVYRVRVYRHSLACVPSGTEESLVGHDHIRILQATKEEYLKEQAIRYATSPPWSVKEQQVYNHMLRDGQPKTDRLAAVNEMARLRRWKGCHHPLCRCGECKEPAIVATIV